MAYCQVLELIFSPFFTCFTVKGTEVEPPASYYSIFIKLKGLFSPRVLFMAKKKNVKKAGKKVPVKTDINSVEKDTLERVSHTLKILEEFLMKWDASAKPHDMVPEIDRVRRFHDELQGWQADALKPHPKEDEDDRIRRLAAFVEICLNYS